MAIDWIEVGARLRNVRYQKGMLQAQVAELAQVRQATVSRLEDGRLPVSWDILESIAEALDVNVRLVIEVAEIEAPAAPNPAVVDAMVERLKMLPVPAGLTPVRELSDLKTKREIENEKLRTPLTVWDVADDSDEATPGGMVDTAEAKMP